MTAPLASLLVVAACRALLIIPGVLTVLKECVLALVGRQNQICLCNHFGHRRRRVSELKSEVRERRRGGDLFMSLIHTSELNEMPIPSTT